MACIETPDPSSEVEEAVAINIFYYCAVALSDKDGSRVISSMDDCGVTALHQSLRARARNVCTELNA
jgi:hypothetical protein